MRRPPELTTRAVHRGISPSCRSGVSADAPTSSPTTTYPRAAPGAPTAPYAGELAPRAAPEFSPPRRRGIPHARCSGDPSRGPARRTWTARPSPGKQSSAHLVALVGSTFPQGRRPSLSAAPLSSVASVLPRRPQGRRPSLSVRVLAGFPRLLIPRGGATMGGPWCCQGRGAMLRLSTCGAHRCSEW